MPGTISALCQRYGISRRIGYKWLDRFEQGGTKALADRSRQPHCSPLRTAQEVEQKVIELRIAHPAWGGRKLRQCLINLGMKRPPSASTITEILRRNGLLNQEDPSAGSKPLQRFEREAPNDLWQMDFKGHFPLSDGQRCHPLTITDDHSRFNLCLSACANENARTVREHLRTCFQYYGMPHQILCDNGPAWSCPQQRGALSQLEAWLVGLGIDPIHGRPYHPQTQGKEERFHKTLDIEVIKTRTAWKSLPQCAQAFAEWRIIYNEIRPHESLDDKVPISCYQNSPRLYRAEFEKLDICVHYQPGETTRVVNPNGQISYRGRRYYVGTAIRKARVVIRAYSETHSELSYGWKSLGLIDLTAPKGSHNWLTKPSKRKK